MSNQRETAPTSVILDVMLKDPNGFADAGLVERAKSLTAAELRTLERLDDEERNTAFLVQMYRARKLNRQGLARLGAIALRYF